MKKISIIIAILLLFSNLSFAQKKKGQLEGLFYIDNDITIAYYPNYIAYLTENIYDIISINGKTVWYVPYEREYKKKTRIRLIKGYLVQYKYKENKDVELFKIKCKTYEFDFTNKTIKKKNFNDDWLCFDKPDTAFLKLKVKEKDIKEKKEPK